MKLSSAVHDAVSSTADIRDIRWEVKADFDALNEEQGAEMKPYTYTAKRYAYTYTTRPR